MANDKIKTTKSGAAAKKSPWETVLTVVIAIILVAGLLIAALKPTGVADWVSMHTTTALKSENFEFNNAHLTYMVYYNYNQQYSTYASYGYASSAGFDTSKPLSQQMYFGSTTQSWLDVFLESSVSSLKECLVLCEEAKANGVELTKEEKDDIKEQMKEMKKYAKEQGVSLGQMYGSKGLKASDIQYVIELQALASKYAQQLTEGFEYSSSDYDTHYNENEKNYQYVDYNRYTVNADFDENATDAEKKAANEKAKAAAEEIKAAIDGGKTFEQAVFEYQEKIKEEEKAEETTSSTTAAATGDDSEKEEEKTEEEKIEEIKESIFVENGSYTEDDEFSEWIYGKDAKKDETKVIAGTDAYTVYQIVKVPERHVYNTVNFHMITINKANFTATETQTSEQVMKAVAAEVQAKIDAFAASSDKTAENFLKIAEAFDKDQVIASQDVLENVGKDIVDSQLGVEGFDDWAFGEDVKTGDVKVFEDEENGIYVAIYYAGTGMAAWNAEVDSDLRSADYEKALEDFTAKHTITTNEKALSKIQ